MGRTGVYVRCLWVEGQNYDVPLGQWGKRMKTSKVIVSGMLGLFSDVSNNPLNMNCVPGILLCAIHTAVSRFRPHGVYFLLDRDWKLSDYFNEY